MDPSYQEDDLLDQDDVSKDSDNKTTVILLSCLLGFTTFCLILVACYFSRRCVKEWNAVPGKEVAVPNEQETPAPNAATLSSSATQQLDQTSPV